MSGSRGIRMCCRNRRLPLNTKRGAWAVCAVLACMRCAVPAFGQATPGPARITLEDAIQLALRHNHTLQAARTTIQQNQAAEITAGLRPNTNLIVAWEYLPILSRPQGKTEAENNKASTEGEIGASYLLEPGSKRDRRIEPDKSATAVTRCQVADNER